VRFGILRVVHLKLSYTTLFISAYMYHGTMFVYNGEIDSHI
jgi:hypothetical protein